MSKSNEKWLKLSTFPTFRLPEWTKKVFGAGNDFEQVAHQNFRTLTATTELARLSTGFLIRDILNRCSQKTKKSLSPDRSLWIYSAHDTTIANILNYFGHFNVIWIRSIEFTFIFFLIHNSNFSYIIHHTLQAYTSNCINQKAKITCKYRIGIQPVKWILNFHSVIQNVRSKICVKSIKKSFQPVNMMKNVNYHSLFKPLKGNSFVAQTTVSYINIYEKLFFIYSDKNNCSNCWLFNQFVQIFFTF